jgi:hypothetical protein
LKDEKQVLYNFKALKELKLLFKEATEWLHILYPHLQITTSVLDIYLFLKMRFGGFKFSTIEE